MAGFVMPHLWCPGHIGAYKGPVASIMPLKEIQTGKTGLNRGHGQWTGLRGSMGLTGTNRGSPLTPTWGIFYFSGFWPYPNMKSCFWSLFGHLRVPWRTRESYEHFWKDWFWYWFLWTSFLSTIVFFNQIVESGAHGAHKSASLLFK